MAGDAIQVFLKEIYFDNPTVRRSVWAYVVTTARRNADGESQVWVANPPFKTSKRDGDQDSDDCVFQWDGDGKLIYSGPAEGLDSLDLDIYMIRDNSKTRQAGELLDELFDDGGRGTQLVSDVRALGGDLLEAFGDAVNSAQPAGAVLEVGASTTGLIGRAMQNKGDRSLIHASGTLTRETIEAGMHVYGTREASDHVWGRNKGDKGYFHLQIVTRQVARPDAVVKKHTLPQAIVERMDHILNLDA